MNLYIYTDGASRGNPGPSAIGIVIKDDKQQTLMEVSEYIGQGTNNNAEYLAVLKAIEQAIIFKAEEVTLYVDSELVEKQLTGKYKVKNRSLKKHFTDILKLCSNFSKITIHHIARDKNSDADKLANLALDRKLNSSKFDYLST